MASTRVTRTIEAILSRQNARNGHRSPDCPHCGTTLELHQPDIERPARLIAVCLDCGRWYIVQDPESNWRQAVLMQVPDEDAIYSRLAASA